MTSDPRSRPRFQSLLTLITLALLSACQSHLPPLDVYPTKPPTSATKPGSKPANVPKVADVVGHIQCELAKIANTKRGDSAGDTKSAEFLQRINNNATLSDDLIKKLTDDNFVATVQLTLEVTDAEGVNPSLTFQNVATGTHSATLGAQWSGTQDRTVTLNYAIDFSRLGWDDALCKEMSAENGESGIQGDLGLADIVADGLLSLNKSASTNVYANTGPTPPVAALDFSKKGKVILPKLAAVPAQKLPEEDGGKLTFDRLRGTILFAPQSAGVLTQGTVNFSGLAIIAGQNYIANWTGTLLPPNSTTDPNAPLYFTLSGPLIPDPSDSDLYAIEKRWGFNPTVTLTGTMNKAQAFKTAAAIPKLEGVIAPAAGSDYASRGMGPLRITLDEAGANFGGPSPPTPAAKSGGSPAASGGGTSFGSLVDFVLIYGLNGSPTFTWKHLKAITGSSASFVTAMRTRTDSMAITFVPACRNDAPASLTVSSFWDTISICDQLADLRGVSESIGYQNNSLMILRNFLVRPQ